MELECAQARHLRIPGAVQVPSYDAGAFQRRDRLISLMLQDRKTLRLLSAPCGYGKTSLASEYAHRMFPEEGVVWVDGSSPEFLSGLDDQGLFEKCEGGGPQLVVFEDVAFLDEDRAYSFKTFVELLMDCGSEVVVTTLPSNDCLRDSQSDRLLLTAGDLAVTERDIKMASVGLPDHERTARVESWRASRATLFGNAPCSVWGQGHVDAEYLTAFFEERLPLSFLRTAFAIMLVGKGSFSDLERVGIPVRVDDVSMMIGDYPFLGVNPLQNEFDAGELSFDDLLKAVVKSGNSDGLLKEDKAVCLSCVKILVDYDKTERAVKLVETFFSGTQCEKWLEETGWSLLDIGEAALLETLVTRCGEQMLRTNPALLALQSWVCGLQGDTRETLYYAKAAMGAANCWGETEQGCVPYALAYLAYLAFCQDEPLEYQKPAGVLEPKTPVEHVAALVCCCTKSELIKGLGVLRGQLSLRNAVAGEELAEVERGREELIEGLVMSCNRLCPGTTAFNLILHIVAGLNSEPLRAAAQEYGCGIMIRLRKSGVKDFTEAVLTTDMWRGGFFGLGTQGNDIRDGRLLDSASAMLGKLTRMCGKGPCAIPWEAGSVEVRPGNGGGKRKKPKKSSSKASRLPVAKVTLFGGLEVLIGDRYISESHWNHRALQLFVVLVLYQGRDVSRDTLFSLLWPGLPRGRARDNFYTAWSHMQALLGEGPYLVRRGEFCSISTRYVSSDVSEFNQLSRRLLTERDDTSLILDIYARMETLYRGELLPGEADCKYIDQQREKYRSIYVDGMVSATHRSLEAQDPRIALWFARKAMDEDTEREDVYYALIRAQIAAGQRCSAIRTYFQCRKFLSDELGLDPSNQTEALYEQLLLSDPTLAKLKPESFR